MARTPGAKDKKKRKSKLKKLPKDYSTLKRRSNKPPPWGEYVPPAERWFGEYPIRRAESRPPTTNNTWSPEVEEAARKQRGV